MRTVLDIKPQSDRELVLGRILDAPPAAVFRAWTDPVLLKQWFAPPPYSVNHVALDVRPGGASLIVMRSPDGTEFPNRGVYLEIVPDQKLVITDAFTEGWMPSDKPFSVASLSFEDYAGQTRYIATVRHWSISDCRKHEQMGFHQGWSTCAEQLERVAASL